MTGLQQLQRTFPPRNQYFRDRPCSDLHGRAAKGNDAKADISSGL